MSSFGPFKFQQTRPGWTTGTTSSSNNYISAILFFLFLKVLGGHSDGGLSNVFYTSIIHEDFYNVLVTNMSVGGVDVNISCREVLLHNLAMVEGSTIL